MYDLTGRFYVGCAAALKATLGMYGISPNGPRKADARVSLLVADSCLATFTCSDTNKRRSSYFPAGVGLG